jgi:uncharacterized protein YneF (UPF0154 family)
MRSIPAPRLGVVVLCLSLALNIFIAGGFFYSQLEAERHPVQASSPQPPAGPEHKLEMLVSRIGIDPQTSRPFKVMRHDFHLAQQGLAGKNRPLGEAYWEELASAKPDEKHLQDLVDQMIANRHAFQSEVTSVLAQFLATLTPEQRTELVKIVEDRNNPAGSPVRNSVGN